MEHAMLHLENYYPTCLQVMDVRSSDTQIMIKLKSNTRTCSCPVCGMISEHYHGTYVRHVQDLPILGKGVRLQIRARQYTCDNPDCEVTTISETYDHFLDTYSRMTDRLADFISVLALESSCEGCARVCQAMHIQISGDSVIRLLLRRYAEQPEKECGSVIGVDDFAFKKRDTYGTIIVDGESHRPVALLDGRDGNALKAWLKQNQHVKVITRDRAGAYASAINAVLPDAIQVADRFHLHQNFLEMVHRILQGIVPAHIRIPKENTVLDDQTVTEDALKKRTNTNQ